MNHENATRPQAIMNLQRYLRQLSYFDESILPPPLSGRWDARTEESLVAFQRSKNLPETGRADDMTWNLLYEEYKRSVKQNSPPLALPLFPRLPFGYEVDAGEESFTVMAIQHMLREITAYYDNIDFSDRTGIYDEPTANAIREFQMRSLLPMTGKVNKETWDYLVEAYRIVFEDYEQ